MQGEMHVIKTPSFMQCAIRTAGWFLSSTSTWSIVCHPSFICTGRFLVYHPFHCNLLLSLLLLWLFLTFLLLTPPFNVIFDWLYPFATGQIRRAIIFLVCLEELSTNKIKIDLIAMLINKRPTRISCSWSILMHQNPI